MLGWILCKLGLHQPVVTVLGTMRVGPVAIPPGSVWATSAYGWCARCDRPYQWDHL